jgi:hypothetical protein
VSGAETVWASGAVEGPTDEAVLRRIAGHVGIRIDSVHGKNGKRQLRQHMAGYNNAARLAPWVILVDLNHEAECAPIMRERWVPRPAPFLCFRIAVRQIESWLLADRERIARFLRVSVQQIPLNPDALDNARDAMVALAGRSRKAAIRQDMVPRPGSGRATGPAYASRLIEFATGVWRPGVAATRSESLHRCLMRLGNLRTHE